MNVSFNVYGSLCPMIHVQVAAALLKSVSGAVLMFPGQKAEGRAGSGAQQSDHDVRHDESAGSCHGKTSRHGAAGGKNMLIHIRPVVLYLFYLYDNNSLFTFITVTSNILCSSHFFMS